jgi:NADH-quinone oxidoreductase subunit A
MLLEYVAIAILIILTTAVGFIAVGLGMLFGPKRPSDKKAMPYESGMNPVGPGQRRMPVRFYLVAMLFILFDIEVVFLYPWASVYREMLREPATRDLILGAMVSFLAILFVGYLYALKKRAFDWRS